MKNLFSKELEGVCKKDTQVPIDLGRKVFLQREKYTQGFSGGNNGRFLGTGRRQKQSWVRVGEGSRGVQTISQCGAPLAILRAVV